MFTKSKLFALTAVFSLLLISSVNAGVLNGNASAVAYSSFSGSDPFASGALSGNLDYAVFTATEFATAFPSSGYSPIGPIVYAYQIESTGAAAISAQIVGVSNPVSGDIDSFLNAPGEVNPSSQLFSGTNPLWSFASPNIATSEFSEILVFSSPNAPMSGAGLTINGGTTALTTVPTPSATAIPEPTSVCLAAAGVLALLLRRKRQA
ncbi:MAG: PEP-CTERM sorting domain-containing protein [Planctomycetes bacterium]|nr:PEP-CTERM sorting domain-containing protein [Planctomycetota bacterium]